jgi:RAP domain
MKSSQPSTKNRAQRSSASFERRKSPSADRAKIDHRRLNGQITKCQSAKELLHVLQSTSKALTKKGGGGALNSVNFSTAMHRLGRFGGKEPSERAVTLFDPRFALLLASLGEAFDPSNKECISFVSRELSNISWAIAKLKIAPPLSVLPSLDGSSLDDSLVTSDLTKTCRAIREQVLEYATERQQQVTLIDHDAQSTNRQQPPWIQNVSRLAGYLLDTIAVQVMRYPFPDRFRMQEYANLLWSWSTSSRVNESTFHAVVDRMASEQMTTVKALQSADDEVLNPQEWSNSIWAAATGEIFSPKLLSCVASLFREHPTFVERFKPQELSNTAWGVATMLSANYMIVTKSDKQIDVTAAALDILRRLVLSASERPADFKTQELANLLWAMATLGFGQTPSFEAALNNYIVLVSDQPDADYQLMQRATAAILEASLPKISKFRSQELNNLAWSLARLIDPEQVQNDKLIQKSLEAIGAELSDERRSVASQDIASTLWSFATLEFRGDDVYRGVAYRMTPHQVRRAKPQELSNSVWALATAEIAVQDLDAFDTTLVPAALRPHPRDRITECFGMVAEELIRRPYDFKPQELKDCLWSFSKIGIRHPSLFKSTAIHLVGSDNDQSIGTPRSFSAFSPQGLGNTAWAYARQCQLACEVSSRYAAGSILLQSNGRLAVYTTSFFDYGESLVQRLFQAIGDASVKEHGDLSGFKPQDLANTAWTFAVLGLVHARFMEAAKTQLSRRLQQFIKGERNAMNCFKAQELSNLLWTMATLGLSAAEGLDEVASYVSLVCIDEKGYCTPSSIACVFKRQELANIAWSCAVFNEFPESLMKLVYTGLFGSGTQNDQEHLSKLYGDAGLQRQAIISSLYVQMAMDLRHKNQRLRLPADFPDGWGRPSGTDQNDDYGTENIELSLITSKIQRDVSAAFKRIGFLHTEEETITMADLADKGLNLAPKVMPILSIDIANADRMIAVEVDGPSHFVTNIDPVHETGGYPKLVNGKLEYQFHWSGDRQSMNGPTVLKERILALLGWKVVHLNFWEWYDMRGDESAEEDFCRRLLT